MKLINEMELIGQPSTEAECYEMLRRNVNNPNLFRIVVKLSLPESRKISLEDFFEDCNHFIQYNKDKDSGRKHKAEEVFGRTVKVVDDSSTDMPLNAVCYRCGRPGHLRSNYNSKMSCSSTVCSLCKAHIGGANHNVRSCCEDSARVFPRGARSDRSSKKKAGGPQTCYYLWQIFIFSSYFSFYLHFFQTCSLQYSWRG